MQINALNNLHRFMGKAEKLQEEEVSYTQILTTAS